MGYNHSNGFVVNEEQITYFLEETVKSVENAGASEVEALDAIKKLFKKVPLFRRKYVTAYLIKQAILSGKANRFAFKDRSRFDSRTKTEFKNNHEERAERPARVKIDPEVSATVFISVGKNRRVFKRDLVGLLVSIAKIDHDRIGDIRLFPHFSFVQLFKEDCDKAIAALNNYEFRGRKLTVNYSKPKEFGAEGSQENDSQIESSYTEAEDKETFDAVSSSEKIQDTEDRIPEGVSNVSSGSIAETSESEKIADAQAVFAENQAPYSETTDDGQVKSHFGDGAAY